MLLSKIRLLVPAEAGDDLSAKRRRLESTSAMFMPSFGGGPPGSQPSLNLGLGGMMGGQGLGPGLGAGPVGAYGFVRDSLTQHQHQHQQQFGGAFHGGAAAEQQQPPSLQQRSPSPLTQPHLLHAQQQQQQVHVQLFLPAAAAGLCRCPNFSQAVGVEQLLGPASTAHGAKQPCQAQQETLQCQVGTLPVQLMHLVQCR